MVERSRAGTFGLEQETAGFVTDNLNEGTIVRPGFTSPRTFLDETARSRNQWFGEDSSFTHITFKETVPKILESGILFSRWGDTRTTEQRHPTIGQGSLSTFFPREKQIQDIIAGKNPTPIIGTDGTPQYSLLVFNRNLVSELMTDSRYGGNEHLLKRTFVNESKKQESLPFLSKTEQVTAAPLEPYLEAIIPVTSLLQETMFNTSVEIVFSQDFEVTEAVLLEMFTSLHNEYQISFLDQDLTQEENLKLLAKKWTVDLYEDYWKTYSLALEELIRDQSSGWSNEMKTSVFRKMYLQTKKVAHIGVDWYTRYHRLLNAGYLTPIIFTMDFDANVELMFSSAQNQIDVLKDLHTVRYLDDVPYRYMTSKGSLGHNNYISSNAFAYWADTRMINIDPDNGKILDAPFSKEDWVMALESYDLVPGGKMSRFDKRKSLNYYDK